MSNRKSGSNRRSFVRKLLGVAAAGGVASVLLAGRAQEAAATVSGVGTSGQVAYWTDTAGSLAGFPSLLNFSTGSVAFGNNILPNGFAATIAGGYSNSTSGDYTTVGGGQSNNAGADHATVAGGFLGTATATYATIGGGYLNGAAAAYATVGGGNNNVASGNTSTIAGGDRNKAGGFYATVGGGTENVAGGDKSIVAGGSTNWASGNTCTIGGGEQNAAGGFYATVGGGYQNVANSSTIGGGSTNQAWGNTSTIAGGQGNITSGAVSTVAGGYGNSAGGLYSTVAGGYLNSAGGTGSFVGGGGYDGSYNVGNSASGSASTVGGGNANQATGDHSTIAGGRQNISTGNYSTATGGYGNTGGGAGSFVGGGGYDGSSFSGNFAGGAASAIAGGLANVASGDYSAIPGGQFNTAGGDNSFAAGYFASVGSNHHGALLFSDDSTFKPFNSVSADEFAVRAVGGFRFVTGVDVSGNVTQLAAIDASGSLGVGTGSPSSALDVNGAVSVRGMSPPAVSPASQGRIYFDSVGNRFKVSENAGAYTDLVTSASGGGFSNPMTAPGDLIYGGISGAALRLGVGSEREVLTALSGVPSWQAAGWSLGGNAGTDPASQFLGTTDAEPLVFRTANVERMRVSESGSVGVGTTSPLYGHDLRTPGSSSAQMHISSTDSDAGGYLTSANPGNLFMSAGAAWNGSAWVAKSSSAYQYGGGTAGVRFFFDTGLTVGSTYTPTTRMFIGPTGHVGIGMSTAPAHLLQLGLDDAAKPSTNTWTIASDGRLKDPESIEPFMEGSDLIKRLPQPVWFRYRKESGLPSDRRVAGWIAQDVAPVAPFMVRRTRQKLHENDSEEAETLSLNTNELPYALVNSMKESIDDREHLRKQIVSLEEDNRRLREENEDRLRAIERTLNSVKREVEHVKAAAGRSTAE